MRFNLALLVAVPLALAATPKMGAVGIAVESIPKSQAFYQKALGFQPTGMKFNTPAFDEIILALPGTGVGSSLVLMQWKTPKNTKDLAVKMVFYVDDVAKTVGEAKAAGAKVVNEPGSLKLGNTTIPTAFLKDLDGYLLELNPMGLFGKGGSVPKAPAAIAAPVPPATPKVSGHRGVDRK